jgi:hypothetical protein
MFFGSSTMDLNITIFLLVGAFIISLVILAVTKLKFLSVMIFSILGNLVFLMDIFTHSELFRAYHIAWLEFFSLLFWPIINILLIYYFYRPRNKSKK